MDLNSQNKVLKAGFMIIRKDDYPQPKIKYKQFGFPEWSAGSTGKCKISDLFEELGFRV